MTVNLIILNFQGEVGVGWGGGGFLSFQSLSRQSLFFRRKWQPVVWLPAGWPYEFPLLDLHLDIMYVYLLLYLPILIYTWAVATLLPYMKSSTMDSFPKLSLLVALVAIFLQVIWSIINNLMKNTNTCILKK